MINYSFIIPHHNSPELLNRCLDSIPQREDIQIIVVDDNSNNNKKPQVSRPDVQIIYIDEEHTKGAGHARNTGLKYARGKWLLFPDCDDYYTNAFIVILDKYKDYDVDVLYFNYVFKDGLTGVVQQEKSVQIALSSFDGSKEKEEIIRFRNNTPWTKMVSSNFVSKIGAYYEEVPNGNDVLFSLWLGYMAHNIEIANHRLYNYIKTENSIGTKKQSPRDILCRLTHIVKHNAFNESLCHVEWNQNPLKFIAYIIKSQPLYNSLSFLLLLVINLPHLLRHRKEWVYLIINKK